MMQRLRGLLPPGWFGDSNPVRDAVLTGCAQMLSWCYTLYAFARDQTRLRSASGGWLDMIGLDFFGATLPRYANQSDDSYRNRLQVNLFRERATHAAVAKVLLDLTGRAPMVVEPARPADVGGLGVSFALGATGRVGSIKLPYQAFVTAYRPPYSGPAGWPGVATWSFGMNSGSAVAGSVRLTPPVSDADLLAAVEAVKPIGATVWVSIAN